MEKMQVAMPSKDGFKSTHQLVGYLRDDEIASNKNITANIAQSERESILLLKACYLLPLPRSSI
jgi:hypothetical protein